MNLADWLKYLESLPRGLTCKSLVTVKEVAKKLEVLEFPSKIITIAGTNGKGSCVVFLEAILMAAGYRVGAYLSPHLIRYNERIRLQGVEIDDESLIQVLSQVEIAKGDLQLTYFEYTTLAALLFFKRQMLDFTVLEVGLGGRYDVVNILDPGLSIITSIALDHTEILGSSREEIGYEKSGIMRRDKIVVCGANMPTSIYSMANNLSARLYLLNRDFFCFTGENSWHWISKESVLTDLPIVNLPINSAALAVMAIKLLKDEFELLSDEKIVIGLKESFLPGRLQRVIWQNRELIFDVAHNPEAAELLALNLKRVKDKSGGSILAVVGMLKDKDILQFLKQLLVVVDHWYLGEVSSVRTVSGLEMESCLKSLGVVSYTTLPTVVDSLELAIAECQEKDTIAMFGSFYTVAAGLKIINVHK